MATITVGTTANTSLTGLVFLPGYNSGMAAADIATINNLILRQGGISQNPSREGGFSANGKLILPGNRGVISCLPGDVVAIDSVTGWPILLSKNAANIASTPWVVS